MSFRAQNQNFQAMSASSAGSFKAPETPSIVQNEKSDFFRRESTISSKSIVSQTVSEPKNPFGEEEDKTESTNPFGEEENDSNPFDEDSNQQSTNPFGEPESGTGRVVFLFIFFTQ